MTVHSREHDFVLTILDIFTLTDRGIAVVGPVESGVLQTGEEVEIWESQHLVTRARATLELINVRGTDPRSIGLLLGGVDEGLLSPGQQIRRSSKK